MTVSPLDQPLHPLIPEVDSPQATGAVTIWLFTGALEASLVAMWSCLSTKATPGGQHRGWAVVQASRAAGEEPGWEGGGSSVEVHLPGPVTLAG